MTAAMPPDEIDSMRKVAQTLVDAENAWRTDETPTKWAAVERARQALESYIDAAELLRLLARLAEAEGLLEAVPLFHKGGYWSVADGATWTRLTGKDEVTTRALCDAIRAHLGARGKEKT